MRASGAVGSHTPPESGGGSLDGRGRAGGAPSGDVRGGRAPTVAAAQTGADAPAAGSTEIMTFTGGAALPSRTGIMVTMGSRPLSGTSLPAAGGLPSARPTTSSGPRCPSCFSLMLFLLLCLFLARFYRSLCLPLSLFPSFRITW
jgi:hypothetical protein